MSLSFSPIGPWYLVAIGGLGVFGLTLWAYRKRLKGTTGRWRWIALGLRLLAVLLCVLAALRPSVVLSRTVKQPAAFSILIDASSSMGISDVVQGQSRWDLASKVADRLPAALKALAPDLDVKTFRFDSTLAEYNIGDTAPPKGQETALGAALVEATKRQSGKRLAAVLLLSDGAGNAGLPPLVAAQRLKGMQVPIVSVGFGSQTAGASSRDVAVKDLRAGPTVFVKNKLQVSGSLSVRGFANQPIDVELFVEGQKAPAASTRVRAPEGSEVVSISPLEWVPQSPGEKKITLRAKLQEGELVPTNNEYSTFVTVLSGGLNVLYLQGPHSPWEFRYLIRALDASPDIQVDLRVIRRPAQGNAGNVEDELLVHPKYNVYILGDLPADFLTPTQQQLLVKSVGEGAGLIMLGGRSSFGAGGWAGSPIADVLPVAIHPGDGQNDPEGGLKVVPNLKGLDNYVLQIGSNRAETESLWLNLPPISGTNRFGEAKRAAVILAETPSREPLLIGQEVPRGRVLAFGGETWPWALATDESRAAHRKLWRQVILWLAHKEDQGEGKVKITLDRRRLALGEKLEIGATVRGAKDEPIADAKYVATVTYVGPDAKPEPVDLFHQGNEARGTYYANKKPGEYKVKVTASKDGKDLGGETARFLVYQDDRELENPAADLALLRQISDLTGGKFLAPEKLDDYLKTIKKDMFTEDSKQTEYRVWDNWPFFLLFIVVLTLEWWLRKRNGWV